MRCNGVHELGPSRHLGVMTGVAGAGDFAHMPGNAEQPCGAAFGVKIR